MENKICPRCQGNGFFKVKESVERKVDIVVQCPMCNSKGEIKCLKYHNQNDKK